MLRGSWAPPSPEGGGQSCHTCPMSYRQDDQNQVVGPSPSEQGRAGGAEAGKAGQTGGTQSCGVRGICCVTERSGQGFHRGLGLRCGGERPSGPGPRGLATVKAEVSRKVPGWIINPLGHKPCPPISGSPPGCFLYTQWDLSKEREGAGTSLGHACKYTQCTGGGFGGAGRGRL